MYCTAEDWQAYWARRGSILNIITARDINAVLNAHLSWKEQALILRGLLLHLIATPGILTITHEEAA